MQQLDKDRQKIIEDFISASEKSMTFVNGIWVAIGKQNTDEEILIAGVKGCYDWKNDHVNVLKSLDHGSYHYILFSRQKEGQKYYESIAMYSKAGFLCFVLMMLLLTKITNIQKL
ncbi:hypothetical protein N6B72_13725 [Chryseobacterium soli]|uniref:hypothetical protein n=1 Tax=Chryseobacterium soli TaxID=445961 RepID=UPI002954CBBF|nr:hypothetical protein [Chryseobacterium soli]MDV7697980.1 hypothetical protein [Chryseobacterium soli]